MGYEGQKMKFLRQFWVVLGLLSSQVEAAPYRTTCIIKHFFLNKQTSEKEVVDSYSFEGQFVEDDDRYQMMVVPHRPMKELPWLFYFRHTLSGPLGEPAKETPASYTVWRRLTAGQQVNVRAGVGHLELGVPIFGETVFSEVITSKGVVNGAEFSCATQQEP